MAVPSHPPAIAPTPAPTAAPPPAPMAVRLPGVAQATARGARKQKVRYFRMTTPCFAALERLARCVFKPFERPPKFLCAGTFAAHLHLQRLWEEVRLRRPRLNSTRSPAP